MSTTLEMIQCAHCGAVNRVDAGKLHHGTEARCGRCKAPLHVQATPGGASGGEVIDVSDATFAREVEQSDLPVLVDLWAPWCGPCRMMAPVVDKLAAEMTGRTKVAKLNIDENQATAARLRVASIPTLLIFKGGREVDRIVGFTPGEEIRRRLLRID